MCIFKNSILTQYDSKCYPRLIDLHIDVVPIGSGPRISQLTITLKSATYVFLLGFVENKGISAVATNFLSEDYRVRQCRMRWYYQQRRPA